MTITKSIIRFLLIATFGLFIIPFATANTFPTSSSSFAAKQKHGKIGKTANKAYDNPQDNFFTVQIDQPIGNHVRVWLYYELKGVSHYTGISKQINDRLATGGQMVELQTDWQLQKEPISATWLRRGENRIAFTLPEDVHYGYEIRNLQIVVEAGNISNGIQLDAAYSVTLEGKKWLYVKGLVHSASPIDQLEWGTQKLAVRDGEFEALLLHDQQDQFLQTKTANGLLYKTRLHIEDKTKETFLQYESIGQSVGQTFLQEQTTNLCMDGVQLEVQQNGLLLPSKQIQITALRTKDVMALDFGLHNLSKHAKGYRFLPHGTHFKEGQATISMAYDRSKLPPGYTEEDIRTYYFDTNTGHWVALERVKLDKELQLVISKTTHFTDMINGVIQSPESPESSAYTPTTMSGIKAADPTAKIPIIPMPGANNSGSANIGYPIELPAGRNGMQPSIGLQYSSDASNGWMGVGWRIGMPSISVDTRWGVPKYKTDIESETYLLNGAMLAGMEQGESFVAHKGEAVSRQADRQFFKRLLGFERIVRKGDAPSNYRWEVTDKAGTIYYYGGKTSLDPNAVLQDPENGNIAEWYLTDVQDRFGNSMHYGYTLVAAPIRGNLKGLQLYPAYISYTGYRDKEGAYRVVFKRDRQLGGAKRIDRQNSGRYGFLTQTADLLQEIEVQLDGQKIRSYKLEYKTGAFSKTLLERITHYDAKGKAFYDYDFEYYDDVQSENGYQPFVSQVQNWDTGKDDIDGGLGALPPGFKDEISSLGGSNTTGGGFSVYVGVGPTVPDSFSKGTSAGAAFGLQNSSANGLLANMDINGDGLPDKIYKNGSSLWYRPNISEEQGNTTVFGEAIRIQGISDFSKVTSFSVHAGPKVTVGVYDASASLGTDLQFSTSKTEVYFTDVNGDGLMDVVYYGKVYFNHIEVNGEGQLVPTFTLSSADTPSPIQAGGTIDSSFTEVTAEEQAEAIRLSPLHDVVRVWEAPWDGRVTIQGTVSLLQPEAGYNEAAYEKADGVRVAIQLRNQELWSTSIAKGDFSPKTPQGVSSLQVKRGDRIYFRLQSGTDPKANGDFDRVAWHQKIRYIDKTIKTDANGFSNYVFDAQESFLRSSSNAMVALTKSQVMDIGGTFAKKASSDDVWIHIKDEKGSILYQRFFAAATNYMGPLSIPNINVENGKPIDRLLFFEVSSSSAIDWDAVSWRPTLVGEGEISDQHIFVRYRSFNTPVLEGTKTEFALTSDGGFGLEPKMSFSNTVDGSLLVTIKKDKTLLGKRRLQIKKGVLQNIQEPILVFGEAGDSIWVEYFATDAVLASRISSLETEIKQVAVAEKLDVASSQSETSEQLAFYVHPTKTSEDFVFAGRGIADSQMRMGVFATKPTLETETLAYGFMMGEDKIQLFANGSIQKEIDQNGAAFLSLRKEANSFIYEVNHEVVFQTDVSHTNFYAAIWRTPGVPNYELFYLMDAKTANTPYAQLDNRLFLQREDGPFGSMYRQWGQFAYNAMDGRAEKPIDQSKLRLPEEESEEPDPLTDIFVPMGIKNDDHTEQYFWKAYNPLGRTDKLLMQSSRLGAQDVVLENPLAGLDGSTAFGITKVNKSESVATMYGLSQGSRSEAEGKSKTITDFMDLNGDRYPDIISGNSVQLTNSKGGFDGDIIETDGAHASRSKSEGWSTSGNAIHSASITSSKIVPNAHYSGTKTEDDTDLSEIAAYSITTSKNTLKVLLNASIPTNEDEAIHSWSDINGDGLVDKILSDKRVRLNLGGRFTEAVDWSLDAISKGKSKSFSASAGVSVSEKGFSFAENTISAGAGLSRTEAQSEFSLMDVNGDGLVDQIKTDGPNLSVRLNYGSAFSEPIPWVGTASIQESISTAKSFNLGFSISMTYALVKLVISPSATVSSTANMVHSELKDIDGDGYVDALYSDSDGEIRAKKSTIGRTNRLKAVYNPLGGSFVIDYKHNQPTYDHPGGKWVMASVEADDGIQDDGSNMRNHFVYKRGKYDRHEREFLGFGEVITESIDTDISQNEVYRRAKQEFSMADYYRRYATTSSLEDADGNLYQQSQNQFYDYQITAYNQSGYQYKTVQEYKPESGIAFSPLRQTSSYAFEGQDTAVMLNQSTYHYGPWGEIQRYDYTDTPNKINYTTTIGYSNFPNHYILSLPNVVRVEDGEGKEKRGSLATYDSQTGALIRMIQKTGKRGGPQIDIEYDIYGNIIKKTLPSNVNEERMFYTYKYEGKLHQYVERIEDAFGYHTRFEKYDYRYGQLLQSEDINGYFIHYEIDDLGRITKITGPNEKAQGVDYTIKMAYHHQVGNNAQGISAPAAAVTSHYDPEHPGDDMETTTIVDGFGRAIQLKKDGVVMQVNADGSTSEQEVQLLSGRTKFDAFGRVAEAYYPTTEAMGKQLEFNPNFDGISPSKSSYDILDRVLQSRLPDNSTSTMEYDLDHGLNALKTTATDALGNSKTSYTNGSGLVLRVEEEEGIQTRYVYDGINQLLEVIDTEGNSIQSEYDLLGRRTKVIHPDAGTTSMQYDDASNLLLRRTANLEAKNQDIAYLYEYNRLKQIVYPQNPDHNVTYHYGGPNASHNRVGRLLLQEDATGGQEFFYGRLGELTKLIRTVIIPNNAVATFQTQWRYDSWNRLQEMIYPDSEKLVYSYNKGGNLDKLEGHKSYTYNYVKKLGYDKFGQRVYMQYCNGAETVYNYDPLRRRLENLKSWTGKGHTGGGTRRLIQDNHYTFDAVSNVLSVHNKAPLPTEDTKQGGQIQHQYSYDNLYRLTTAQGHYSGFDNKTAAYSLQMEYDKLHNIVRKTQAVTQTGVQFDGQLYAGYDLEYHYGSKPHQLENIAEKDYRAEKQEDIQVRTIEKGNTYQYDPNGNMVYVHTSRGEEKVLERKLLWDEENRLEAVSDNGYVSLYTYDAGGERVVKSSGAGEGVYVNSAFSGARTQTNTYTAYINPYMVIQNGGAYTKHIYIGSQRVVSKLGDLESFGEDPRRIEKAGEATEGVSIDFGSKYKQSIVSIKRKYAALNVPYHGKDNDDYTGGTSFCCGDQATAKSAEAQGGKLFENEDPELLQYYYHADHLGSSSFITNLEGEVVQHLEYVPFGEVFIESKNARWNTPYKFNAKELDEETGLYYYGARYYNPKVSLWLSIDPLWEEVGAHRSPYEYTYSNPIMFIDPTGMGPETKFKNRLTNETVEVRDGIEKTIVVNDSDFQKAKFFANEINPNPGEYGFLFTGVNKDIAQAYNDFYDNVKYYDGYSLSNLYHYLFVKPKLLISNPDPLSGSGGVEFIGGAGKPLIKNGGRYLAKSLGKHLSIQKHHIIPQAVFKKYKTMLEPFMKIGGGFNLKKLPTPFHGNHPKYNEYVGKLISQLGAKNNINAKTLRELQARLNKEINKAYDSGMKLNEYFRILNNNL